METHEYHSTQLSQKIILVAIFISSKCHHFLARGYENLKLKKLPSQRYPKNISEKERDRVIEEMSNFFLVLAMK